MKVTKGSNKVYMLTILFSVKVNIQNPTLFILNYNTGVKLQRVFF